jgi:hypothetical protein
MKIVKKIIPKWSLYLLGLAAIKILLVDLAINLMSNIRPLITLKGTIIPILAALLLGFIINNYLLFFNYVVKKDNLPRIIKYFVFGFIQIALVIPTILMLMVKYVLFVDFESLANLYGAFIAGAFLITFVWIFNDRKKNKSVGSNKEA